VRQEQHSIAAETCCKICRSKELLWLCTFIVYAKSDTASLQERFGQKKRFAGVHLADGLVELVVLLLADVLGLAQPDCL
jgi:hypothetical protein